MVNLSISSVVFEWEKCSSSYIIEVEPPVGELGNYADGELDAGLTYEGISLMCVWKDKLINVSPN